MYSVATSYRLKDAEIRQRLFRLSILGMNHTIVPGWKYRTLVAIISVNHLINLFKLGMEEYKQKGLN